ncbi:hypothetical protein L226DRAFT_570089 [Lentinus tigrinus ALCF2SS1-7]|uniref:DUF6534 domain-containing protein n=1 Tax=Lentinus tigrinus ALCF2SS1-6 TaxID=1328759 RepID=A0A5C2SBW5_9APHY|nr:hypothetical protein L227DRAFT_611136 [Lentinus tigrinus ALCF2SS1-6]RPD75852.1 hypothetical protein L226DRAFT_570089 [Lentinus tigrinus ALCF2SS1-7]
MTSLTPNSTASLATATDSSSSPGAPALPVMDNTYGALLLGTCGAILIQGMIFHQLYRYYKLYPKDALYLKLWVGTVTVLELVSLAFALHGTYYYMVTHAFDPTALVGNPPFTIAWSAIPATVAAVLVELFFCRRLWFVGKKFRPIVVLAIIFNLGDLACFTAFAILGIHTDATTFLKHSYLATVGSGFIGLADFMVTSSLIYVLHTSRSGVTQTSSMIDLLIKYVVSTGLIICVFNVLIFVFSLLYPQEWIYAGLSLCITKVYLSTFLVGLNARHTLLNADILRREQTFQIGSMFNFPETKLSHLSFGQQQTTTTFSAGTTAASSGLSKPSTTTLAPPSQQTESFELKSMSFAEPGVVEITDPRVGNLAGDSAV